MNPYVESLKRVWESPNFKPQHVFINHERLEEIAQKLARQELPLPQWREEVFPQEDDDTFIDFLIVSGAINFCFTDFTTGKKYDVEYPEGSGKIWYGSMAMFAALKRAMDERINILEPRVLAKLDLGEVYYIFRQANTPIPMIGSRWRQLQRLGQDSFGASFAEEFNYLDLREVVKCVEHLTLQYSYSYEECCLEFNKRAQLVPMMYHGRAMSSGGKLQPIRDPENFGPICDYQLPKALRYWKTLRYSPELAAKVDRGVVIEENSGEEVEIRLQTAQAMCSLLERINELRPHDKQITMAELDNFIWHLGREAPGRHHYTYTTAY